MRKNRVTPRVRKIFYLTAILIFGIILSSDPSAMGTVKDAIHLYASTGAIFPPRLIAMAIFLLTVFLANKFICAWGCQLGTLQDLIFRLGRNVRDTKGDIAQYKIPFAVTNTVRVLFFIVFTVVAFIWAVDIVEPVDPFKVFNITILGTAGIAFIVMLMIASLFIYRPWCHFFCPFGLVGWVVEKNQPVQNSDRLPDLHRLPEMRQGLSVHGHVRHSQAGQGGHPGLLRSAPPA